MKLPVQPPQYHQGLEQRRSAAIEASIESVATKVAKVYTGMGAPGFTPNSRAIYIREDGGTGTTLYVYEGASWVAK